MKLTLSFLFSLIVGLAFAFPQTDIASPLTQTNIAPPLTQTDIAPPLTQTDIVPPLTLTAPPSPPGIPIRPPPLTTPTTQPPPKKCCNSNIGHASGHNTSPGCTGNTVLGGAIKGMTGLASWFAHEINILLGSDHLCPPKQCENPCDQIPQILNTTELAQALICEPENATST